MGPHGPKDPGTEPKHAPALPEEAPPGEAGAASDRLDDGDLENLSGG